MQGEWLMTIPTMRRLSYGGTLYAAALLLVTLCGHARAQQAAGRTAAEMAVEELFEFAAQAFINKDQNAIQQAFVENFAGPFRVPQVARTVLSRVVKHAEGITADFDLDELQVVDNHALAVVGIDLSIGFAQGPARTVQGPYLAKLVADGDSWKILSLDQLDEDWSVDADGTTISWEAEGIAFPLPQDWGVFPVKGPETRKGVHMVAPDLRATIGVGTIDLPVPVSLEAVAANHKGIDQFFPGSRFIGETQTTVAGEPAVSTQIELKLGPERMDVRTTFMLYGKALHAFTLIVAPADAAPSFLPVMERLVGGVKLTKPAQAFAEAEPATTYKNDEIGVTLRAPEGWNIQPLDAELAKKRGWSFAAHIKPAQGETFVLVGGRKFSGQVGLADLQRAEMDNLRMIVPDAKAEEVKDFKVCGFPARSWTCTFTMGQERKRREAFVARGAELFWLIADVIPPSDYAKIGPDVDRILTTMTIEKR